MPEIMPVSLARIREQVRQSQPMYSPPGASQQDWAQRWLDFVTQARRQVPNIRLQDEGEVAYLGQLSPGCQACKNGTWDCIFTTMRCNLSCRFCCSPHAIAKDFAGSAFGSSPEQIIENHARTDITGVSFSGGDPFVDRQRLFNWISKFRGQAPQQYMWLYTNGVLVTQADLERLRELALDEIRFNLAATGYNNSRVLKNLELAAQFIPNLTVEIPAIPGHAQKVLDSLKVWASLGVKYLNLHELICEEGTNAASMPGPRCMLILADGHRTEVNPESRLLTLAVMKKVQDERLPCSVNDCSMQSKIRQLRGRRRSLAPLVKASYEKLIGDQVYESYCLYWGEKAAHFFHPDSLPEMRQQYPDCQFVRLVRTAPLSLQDGGRWIAFERFGHDGV